MITTPKKRQDDDIEIESIFQKPGHEWTDNDIWSVWLWLNQPEKLSRILSLAQYRLGYNATRDDAINAWDAFLMTRRRRRRRTTTADDDQWSYPFHRMCRQFDPSKGRFWPSYCFACIKLHCLGQRRRRGLELANTVPIAPDDDGMSPADNLPDTRSDHQPHEALWTKEAHLELSNSVAGLPPLYRGVIAMRLGGEPDSEIAAKLQISQNTVRQRVHRAILRLRERMQHEGGHSTA